MACRTHATQRHVCATREVSRWNARGDPMRPPWDSLKVLVLLGGLAWAASFADGECQKEARRLPPQSFEVLGVKAGSSKVVDVESILGAAPVRQATHVEEAARCYASPGHDRTVIEFDSWLESVAAFEFFKGSPRTVSSCAKSKLVSSSLSTANGLRLGMTHKEVVTVLGPPTKGQGGHLTYESSYDRPPTPDEVKQFRDASRNPPASINVYERIHLRLRGGKVVRVGVARGRDW